MRYKNWPKCPKCKSQNVLIVEHWKHHTISWYHDMDQDEGIIEMGDPYKVEANCQDCKHVWWMRGIIQIKEEWFEEE
jgi:hypothetical protein